MQKNPLVHFSSLSYFVDVALTVILMKNESFSFFSLTLVGIKSVKLKSFYSNRCEKEKEMVISSPTNFEHTLHVHLNLANGEFIVIYIQPHCFTCAFFIDFFVSIN